MEYHNEADNMTVMVYVNPKNNGVINVALRDDDSMNIVSVIHCPTSELAEKHAALMMKGWVN